MTTEKFRNLYRSNFLHDQKANRLGTVFTVNSNRLISLMYKESFHIKRKTNYSLVN